jgi:hypothetical protein
VSLGSKNRIARNRLGAGFRLSLVALAVLLAVSLSACAVEHRTNISDVTQADLAAGGEPYFDVGPVTYQIQITRQLNPFSNEDVGYLSGVSNAQTLPGSRFWFGVFLWAKNQASHPELTANHFELVDSAGTVYHPVALNASINPYAWTGQRLGPNATEPAIGTTASFGPTGGGLVLFDLGNAVYSNRPLALRIYAPGARRPSIVSLDL